MARDDHFPLETSFGEVGKIFSDFLKPASEIMTSCNVYLDANTLLMPFKLDSGPYVALLNAYKQLAGQNRIFLPAQAAREFAKNRGGVIAQIVKTLRDRKSAMTDMADIPVLRHFDLYEKFKEQKDAISRSNHAIKEVVDEAIAVLNVTPGHDPITRSYNEILSGRIVDLSMEARKDFSKDVAFRSMHKIPPGYKDGNKSDEGSGDLIIWKTILEHAKAAQKDAIVVSSEKKADWFDRVDKQPFGLRYELIEEFRKETGGKSIHVVQASEFLDLMKASSVLVKVTANLEANSFFSVASVTISNGKTDELIEEVVRNSARMGVLWGIIGNREIGFDNGEPITLMEAKTEFSQLKDRNEEIKRLTDVNRTR